MLAAGDEVSTGASDALEALCRAYWCPLYAFVRRRGYPSPDAEDLTQEFFARLCGKAILKGVSREKGRFRAFLLASIKNLIANEFDRANTLQRGGDTFRVPIDSALAEVRLAGDPDPTRSPENLFDRQWALTVLERAMQSLESEYQGSRKGPLFERLRRFLSARSDLPAYSEVARDLGMTAHAVTMAVSRLRVRYRELVRAQIADTVSTPAEVDEEMRYLVELLS